MRLLALLVGAALIAGCSREEPKPEASKPPAMSPGSAVVLVNRTDPSSLTTSVQTNDGLTGVPVGTHGEIVSDAGNGEFVVSLKDGPMAGQSVRVNDANLRAD